ncbi:hypothetical protein CYMTET_8966 [Cymbomonas tetramitiformis]|uniref:Uncharacterized protein n=1 Tax=Cymbomonas tetramitiformis TaxID=36881 RepID=A0AAE0GRZ1_9CHLO|nr:hypothetical protein CYMTET_8966 [Cymbomonas tetramitiformis]
MKAFEANAFPAMVYALPELAAEECELDELPAGKEATQEHWRAVVHMLQARVSEFQMFVKAKVPSFQLSDVTVPSFFRKRKRVHGDSDEEEARAAEGGSARLPPLDAARREQLAALGSSFRTVNEDQLARALRGELAPEDIPRSPADFTVYHFSEFYEHLVRQVQRSTVGISLEGCDRVWRIYQQQHRLQPGVKKKRSDYKWQRDGAQQQQQQQQQDQTGNGKGGKGSGGRGGRGGRGESPFMQVPQWPKSRPAEGSDKPSKKLKTDSTFMGADVVLTTYGTLRRDVEMLRRTSFSLVVIDEAQQVKNAGSQASKAVKAINVPPGMRIALSGTPVENKLAELHSLFDFILPGYLGTVKEFEREYSKPIEKEQSQEALESLKKVTAPFLLRRLKTDRSIIQELPEKVVNDTYAALTPRQAALYESVVSDTMATLETGSRRGLVLKLMTNLKQICNHVANYDSSHPAAEEPSGKLQVLHTLLEPILEKGEKVLIFTQYVTMARLLQQAIRAAHHVNPLMLQGDMARHARDAAVARFQRDPSASVFILSLKAGGVGLNLTAANHIIHYDLWWNPAVEAQATDRAFRIGQERNVFVYRLITQNTFEEKVNDMMKKKQELSDLSVDCGENWIGDLSDTELREMFQHRNAVTL